MSDLLVVVPPGWTDATEGWKNSSGDMTHIAMLINDRNWVDVQQELQGADITGPVGTFLTGATFMALEDGVHLWVRFE